MQLSEVAEWFRSYINPILTSLSFLVIFLVQLKIIRAFRSETNLIIFYGKQVEELRKMLSANPPMPRKPPEVQADETGLYDVLKD
jgi:hypothetical protein